MAINPGNYTSTQIQQFGLDPNNTTDVQNVGGAQYRLSNDNRGGRNVELVNGGSPNPSAPSSGNPFSDTIQRAIQLSQQAVQPAVQSLQSTIPTTQQYFNNAQQRTLSGIQPLQDRYQSLIDSIKGNQTVAENRQTVTTNNELGARGILPSSGVAQQELTNALNPITQQYSGMLKDTGFQENSDIKGLQDQAAQYGDQGQLAVQNILNQIANLQSGASQSGITLGTNQYQFDTNSALQAAQNALEQKKLDATLSQNAIDNALKTRQVNYETSKPYYSPADTMDLSSIIQSIQGITNNANTAPSGNWVNSKGQQWTDSTKQPVGKLPNGQTLYSDGSKGWSQWTFQ